MSERSQRPEARSTAVVGLQWGDEGKGKIVDLITPGHAAVVRYNGGANAGHSVVVEGKRHSLHLIPSGILHEGSLAVIGNGVVVDPVALLKERDGLHEAGVDVSSLRLSDRAHVVMPYHKDQDAARESLLARGDGGADKSIGTTRRGIGPAYADKIHRSSSVRVGDLLRAEVLRGRLSIACDYHNREFPESPRYRAEALAEEMAACGERLRGSIVDTVHLLHGLLDQGERLLFEGANATLLDVDHGTYPFVTSSSTCVLGVGAGSGVSERRLGRVIGVMKSYCTRVGAGPFPTELFDGAGERIRERGNEYGTTTGRPRRTGWLDLVAARYSVMLNDCDEVALTLLDVLAGFETLKVCTSYRIDGVTTDRFDPDAGVLGRVEPIYEELPGFREEITDASSRESLPEAARRYVERIESFIGRPIRIVSVGADRAQTIVDSSD
jgi:adenylosuccinate synthase